MKSEGNESREGAAALASTVFADSAFKHGDTEEDFYELLAGRYLKDRSRRGVDAVYELLERNFAGNYLHVVYRILPDGRVRVFHMARMTSTQKRLYRRRLHR